jgi:hypothetical protein
LDGSYQNPLLCYGKTSLCLLDTFECGNSFSGMRAYMYCFLYFFSRSLHCLNLRCIEMLCFCSIRLWKKLWRHEILFITSNGHQMVDVF